MSFQKVIFKILEGIKQLFLIEIATFYYWESREVLKNQILKVFQNLKNPRLLLFEVREVNSGNRKKKKRCWIDKLPSQNEIMMDKKWWFAVLLKSRMQHESCIVIWVFWLNYYYCLLWHDCTKPSSCRLKETLIKKLNILSKLKEL